MSGGRPPSGRGRGADKQDAELLGRRMQALDLATDGWSVRAIAAKLGVSKTTAAEDVEWAMTATVSPKAEQMREIASARLTSYRDKALEVLGRQHVVLYQGVPVRVGGDLTFVDGEPVMVGGELIVDDGPHLQAIETLRRLEEREAKLHGYDAPTRSEVTGKDGAQLVPDGMSDRLAAVIRAAVDVQLDVASAALPEETP